MADEREILVVTLNPALDLSIGLPTLALGAVNRTQSSQLAAAGKGLNVARVLAALGHRVTLSGLLGATTTLPSWPPAPRRGSKILACGCRVRRESTPRSPKTTAA
ncbi:PfkB family carbohydrate kinase [Salinicola tamaricis]|uniref:PfkB family carbohydrate kinase n=1 Tax=Salinicola tamaricis TaxID=1771309 RepID=UPI0030F3A0D7